MTRVYDSHILRLMDVSDGVNKCTGFEWDDNNAGKIWRKHRVSPSECEMVFFNKPLVAGDDVRHSESENRMYVLGRTEAGRLLFLVFTVRHSSIRVITARDMNRKERKVYQSHE